MRRRGERRSALSIYVHIPFCIQKCGYCDFNAYLYRGQRRSRLPRRLRQEIIHTASRAGMEGYHVPSVYFGGGTPSTLAPAELIGLLDLIRTQFSRVSRCGNHP